MYRLSYTDAGDRNFTHRGESMEELVTLAKKLLALGLIKAHKIELEEYIKPWRIPTQELMVVLDDHEDTDIGEADTVDIRSPGARWSRE